MSLNILPLITAKDITLSWPHKWNRPQSYLDGYFRTCRAELSLTNVVQVSPFEVSTLSGDHLVKREVERTAVRAVLQKIYPKELVRELREINHELSVRLYRSYGYNDDCADLRERLSVVTAQLADLP